MQEPEDAREPVPMMPKSTTCSGCTRPLLSSLASYRNVGTGERYCLVCVDQDILWRGHQLIREPPANRRDRR